MQKFSVFILAVGCWLLVVFPAKAFAYAASLSLEPATGTYNRGCSFPIKVLLDTAGTKTDGTDAIILYDPSRFSINSSAIVANTAVYPDFPGNNVDEAAGKITISGLASVSTPFSSKGTLATLNFTVKDTAPTGATQMTFEFDPNNKANTRDSNVVERTTIADVLNSVVNGSYTVGTGACGVAASPRPGGGPEKTATPSATKMPLPTSTALPDRGTQQLTSAVAIIGGILTILGILGLALL